MKGARPLEDAEIGKVLASWQGKSFYLRNKALFLLGIRSGFRISELLSIRVRDVIQNGTFVDRVSVARQYMKKKTEGRTVVLHPEAGEALKEWVSELTKKIQSPDTFVFVSREGGNRPIDRKTAWRIFTDAFRICGMTGKLGTHCMRKTFAKRVYNKLERDLIKTQKAMGHASVNSTVSYLSFAEEEVDDAILKS